MSDLNKNVEKKDLVGEWLVPIKGEVYKIEFEHGGTTGRRVIWINGEEILRRDWMFKLVGDDEFTLDNGTRCIIRVDPAPGLKYKYTLYVGGKPFDKFREYTAKSIIAWVTTVNDKRYRVVLEKDTLNIFLNGQLRDETGIFVDDGTDTIFMDDGNEFVLSARASGLKHDAMNYTLKVNSITVLPEEIKFC